MAARGSPVTRRPSAAATTAVQLLGVVAAVCALASTALAEDKATRVRRSDELDNMDNFLMGSSDYDNFFLKTAKSVPRIGRRSGEDADQTPLHVDRRSTDANELVPSYANGYDHFFLKASKSVPRIGKRNDEFFMKTAKSVPRIGRRSGDGPDDFLLKVEDVEWPAHATLGGHDAVLGRQHRVQRRNYDDIMAKAAKSVPRMGKRMHPALDEIGEWGTEETWPWFRQQDTSPGPSKRVNPADLIDLSDVPWESMDAVLRRLEAHRGRDEEDKHVHDVVLLEGDAGEGPKAGDDKWLYTVGDKKARSMTSSMTSAMASPPSTRPGSKELEEARFQPDV